MQRPKISGIYALICPQTGDIKYVGQSVNIYSRYYSGHRSKKKGASARLPVSAWVKKLHEKGLQPSLKILEETNNLDDAEKKWIDHFGLCNLLNIHGGGKQTLFIGNGKSSCVTSVEGMPSPYALLVRALWAYSKTPSGKKIHAYWKKKHAEAKTELDKVVLQMNCFNAVCALNKGELAVKAEQWAMAAAPQINAKYPGRVTLVYNDGVEETP